jgi:hypothetical protein
MCSEAYGPPAIVASVDAIVAVGWVGLSETSLLQLCDAGLTDAVARGLDPSRLHPDRLIARVAAHLAGSHAILCNTYVSRRALERARDHMLRHRHFAPSPHDGGNARAPKAPDAERDRYALGLV